MNILKTFSSAAIVLGLTSIATVSSAQMSYYVGGGLAYSLADSNFPGAADTSSGGLIGLGVTLGMRYDSQNVFYGAEVDGEFNVAGALENSGFACDDGFARDAYYCSQDTTVRLRGLVGTNLSGYDVFATVGYGMIYGQRALAPNGISESAISSGLTFGIGAQTPLYGGTIRFELIQDNFTNSVSTDCCGSAPEWTATTAKVSYLWSF